MIDFENKNIFKLKQEKLEAGQTIVSELLIDGEYVVESYASMRDRVVFTNKRVITVNTQGITGSKKDYTSIPYNKIVTYSIETAGMLDLDAELTIWLSGVGKIVFEIKGNSNIKELCKSISQYVL